MNNWSVRARIVAAFATIILIMAVLAAVSLFQLRDIRRQATLMREDVLPGLLLTAGMSSNARNLLPAVVNEATGLDEEQKARSRTEIEGAIGAATSAEQRYQPTITQDTDQALFTSMVAARKAFADAYTAALADRKLDPGEVSASLRPAIARYVTKADSLLELNRHAGLVAVDDIGSAASIALSTLLPALIVATLVAIVCAWLISRLIEDGFSRLTSVTKLMSQGDFRDRIAVRRRDELGRLGEGINRMADDLTALIGQVQQSGIQVNSSATEIAATSKQQQATATEIAATTSEVGATAMRISATSKELVRTVDAVSEVAGHASALAQSGQDSLGRMERSMHQIGEASNLINSRLALLSEKAANIGMVVTTINKVADQTNLLSLNAAIEAEKAGEHGRGFAVVAREIRRLADQTAAATFDIEQLVKEMQSAVSAGVMGMDKFSEEVRRGGESVGQVTAQLSEIIDQVQTLTPNFEAVNEGVQSQSTSAQQISDALAQLSVAAQQTADSLRQSNMAIEQLNDAARGLQAGVSRFTLAG